MNILLVDDDESIRLVVSHQLREAGYSVTALKDGTDVFNRLKEKRYHIALLDNKLPDTSGTELLSVIKKHSPDTIIILITAYATVELAVELMKKGAFDFLTKPVKEQDLLRAVHRAEEVVKVSSENKSLKEKLRKVLLSETLESHSPSFNAVLSQAKQAAPTDVALLITGETGTGKEHLAHDIHTLSGREEKPFIAINCGAIPEQLLESELFGYTKGSFTGAEKDKKGKIEAADGGTLFLDEIGELPLAMQAKLLRFLQEKQVERIGETTPRTVDVRVISATNKDLREECLKGNFREDLYYRLAVIPLHLPPLRERKEDIPLLLHHFLKLFCEKHRKNITGFAPDVSERLLSSPWKGNIREMKNLVERLVILHPEGKNLIQAEELPKQQYEKREKETAYHLPTTMNLQEIEKETIQKALIQCGGNKSKTARLLGITRNTLLYRLSKLKISSRQEGE